jgi:electron transfer flavoprotein beta subunit
MRIIVCAKQVVSLPGPVVLLADASDVDPLFTTRRLNEADEHAMEAALRLSEACGATEVVAVTVGPEGASEGLRRCLAMGANRALRIWNAGLQVHDPIAVARALARAIRDESAKLVLCGAQSSDAANQATGPALASALGLPCVTLATSIELCADREVAIIRREPGGAVAEVVEVDLPAVVTVQTGGLTPRTGSFKAAMMAKKTLIPLLDPGPVDRPEMQVLDVSKSQSPQTQLEWLDGGPAEVAARIAELLREAQT